jgi:mannose-6-phosphate isomerase-like protein (cupin superfamily)
MIELFGAVSASNPRISTRVFVQVVSVDYLRLIKLKQQLGDRLAVTNSTIRVSAGKDRFQTLHQAFGLKPIDFKVSTGDTEGRFFIIENGNSRPGGPPRHVHHAQEEWFYVLEGEYVIEVGETSYELHPGDSILAPRAVPHVWACIGGGNGRLLIVFQPAGQMEAFFEESTLLDSLPPQSEVAALFARHGMTVVGPPLAITPGKQSVT